MLLEFIQSLGLWGIFFVVFAESGLFFGFFLPGDSLLFSAGLLASAGYFNAAYLLAGCFAGAVLGDSVGYWSGKKLGPKIFSKPDSFFFSKSNLDKTSRFYERYGKKTIVLARFVPVVRTFAPILAGAANMSYKDFFLFNILGGLLWTSLIIGSAYFLGNLIPDIDRYIFPIILFIIALSLLPVWREFVKGRQQST